MSSGTDQCKQCGTSMQPTEPFCPNCGLQQQHDVPIGNPFFQQDSAPDIGQPSAPSSFPQSGQVAPPGYGSGYGTGYGPEYGSSAYGAMPVYNSYRGPVGTNGYAIASLVLSLLGLCGIGSVLGIIFGGRARREIRESRGAQTGDGLALAGIIIGWITLALIVFWVLAIMFLGTTEPARFSSVGFTS